MTLPEKILLEYSGCIDYKIIDKLIEKLRLEKEFIWLDRKTAKRVYAIIVECLENIAKHSRLNPVNSNYQPYIYVARIDREIIVKSGNPLLYDEREKLNKILGTINDCGERELLTFYEDKINSITENGGNGAGLGFMLMKLKAENNIKYNFSSVDNDLSFIELQISVKAYSMRKLIVDQTSSSPLVVLDPIEKRYEISGESRPPDVAGFYSEILNWIDDYSYYLIKTKEEDPVDFNFDFEYFNSSSAKYILDFCKKIADVRSKGKNINVRWHYEDDDKDMLEVGKEMSRMSKLPFEYIIKGKK
jgi:hypothetical protein